MKDIGVMLGKILGLLFAMLIIAYTSMLTLQLAQRLTPENPILQYMTLILFDGAALVWFIQFITQAKGTMQWATAGLGFLVGLLGAIIMAGGELILGQSLVVMDDPTRIGWVLVATVIIAALAHATLIYAFHFTDPEVKNRIENSQKVSKVIEQTYQDARLEIDRQAEVMGKQLAASLVYEAQTQLRMAALPHMRRAAQIEEHALEGERGAPVVEARSRDVKPGGNDTQGNGGGLRRPLTLPGAPVMPPVLTAADVRPSMRPAKKMRRRKSELPALPVAPAAPVSTPRHAPGVRVLHIDTAAPIAGYDIESNPTPPAAS